jgi:hypothetical protein
MSKPEALARTLEEATPKVREYIEGLLGETDLLVDFYECIPATHSVRSIDRDGTEDSWEEGLWGAKIEMSHFAVSYLRDWMDDDELITIDDADIDSTGDCRLHVTLALSARLEEDS